MNDNRKRGYRKTLHDEILASNSSSLGVQLGKICVTRNIPVVDVAEHFGISRQAVYLWFRGEVIPSKTHTEKLEGLLYKLSQN